MDKFNVMVGKWKKRLPEHNYRVFYMFVFSNCVVIWYDCVTFEVFLPIVLSTQK